jgi:hypothetical protein
MMKKILFLLFMVISPCAFAQSQIISGLMIGGGKGTISDIKIKNPADMAGLGEKKWDMAVGYKFRLPPSQKRYFYDMDITLGFKRVQYDCYKDYWPNFSFESRPLPSAKVKNNYFQISVNPTWNYTLFQGWYAGAGIEPTFYLVSNPNKYQQKDSYSYDMPLTAKFGYDFKYVDIAVGYKYGLCNTLNTNDFSSGKFRNWQIQVFIPF